MPRTLDPVLRQGLERANPVTCDIVEVTAPDVGRVLRRSNDQFFSSPPRVSETPSNTTAADAGGALALEATALQIASLYDTSNGGDTDILIDPSNKIKGVAWTIDPTFGRAILKKFTARIARLSTDPVDLQLQIYRPKVQRMFFRDSQGNISETRELTFLEVLPEPVVTRYATITWVSNGADVVFDLGQLRPEVGPGPILGDPLNLPIAQNPPYLFVVSAVLPPPGKQVFKWLRDELTSNLVAGVGRFQYDEYGRVATTPGKPWSGGTATNNFVQAFKLEIETYDATSQLVYLIDLGATPIAAATGRIVFERSVPVGTAAALELSTAGSGGPWTAVKHGDVVATKQATYHVRLTLDASSSGRLTPRVAAFGIDFRVPFDVSAEGSIEPVAHEIQVPFCQAGIGEGRVTIVRAGRRDFQDIGSELAVRHPGSRLEVDHYIGSRHPKITRDRWFHLERAPVTNREPVEAAETLSLLSPLKALKKKIPARIETINKIHTVVTASTGQVQVTPNLDGAVGTGDYLGKGYYMRVRSSAQAGVASGFIQTINSNTNLNKLDFTTALPGTLIALDVIEVHSAQFSQPVLEWNDADPADVWWELLTVHLVIPPERIGFAGVGQAARSGLPPRVTDRAPSDAVTQGKLKVTGRIKTEEDGDKLVDEISFLLGGCTVAIAGQIVFRQIYPLRDANDQITVPTAKPDKALDPRDYAGLQTPTGIESRITTLSCDYGVNSTLVSDDTQAASTTTFVDADAVAWLATQDVEGLGQAVIDKRYSRWCYNSADAGLFLATQLNKQVVRATSTGMRVWSWTAVDQHPELHVGDSVWIVTDQYTDYDPSRGVEIRGWWAFRAIIISAQAGGRRFRALVPGLLGAVPIKGGTGTKVPDPTENTPPEATITFVRRSPTTETVRFSGALGGVGPLEWAFAIDDGAFTAFSAAPLPSDLEVARRLLVQRVIRLQTRQADGQITTSAPYFVAAIHSSRTGDVARRVEEDFHRGGRAGVPVRGRAFETGAIYNETGVDPLIDTALGRFTTQIRGPSGAFDGTVIERGSGRGDGGFTTFTGSLVSTAVDSRAALLNNHFRYSVDGAAGVVEDALRNFTHGSYIDASRRPINLRNASLARDVVANDIDVGQERSRGGFSNSTGGLVATAVDSRAALLNNHFRYATDGPGGIVETSAQKFVHGDYIDGSRRPILIRDGTRGQDVTGNVVNTAQRVARRADFARVVPGEEQLRTGYGGVPTSPARSFVTVPVYDRLGATPLIDPDTKEILSGLAIGSGVRGASDVAFGAGTKFTTTRHSENASGVSTGSINFVTDYEAVPEIIPSAKDWILPGTSSTSNRRIEIKELDPTVSGFDIRAVMSTGSSTSSQTENPATTLNGTPAASQSITADLGAVYWNLSNANSAPTTYRVYFDVDTSACTGPGVLNVKLYKNDDTASTTWTEVASRNYDFGALYFDEFLEFTGAMAANWDLRIVMDKPGGSGWIGAEVEAFECAYEKVTAGSESALTGAGSVIYFQAKERS